MSELPEDTGKDSVPAFTPPTAEELGAMLPHYTIHYLIASGGMGAVYRGLQTDLDRPVAIKILPPEAGDDAESLSRFRTEARAMAKLNHPNIVSIYDFGEVGGNCYFVMEYVEGRNVYELITGRQMTPDLALHVLSQVCDALTFAHGKGIVHGDIKPANIVVDGDGVVKLLDFGLARLMEHGQTGEDWQPMGTPEYAAPELYDRSAKPDHRADLYALGIILYEMLTGQVPQGSFQLPTTLMKVDPRVDVIVVRALKADPSERFQAAAEIKSLLEDIRTGKAYTAPTDLAQQAAATQLRTPSVGRRGRMARPGARRGPTPTGTSSAGGGTRHLPPTAKAIQERFRQMEEQSKKQKQLMIGGMVALIIAVVLVVVATAALSGKDKDKEKEKDKAKPEATKPPEKIEFAPKLPPRVGEHEGGQPNPPDKSEKPSEVAKNDPPRPTRPEKVTPMPEVVKADPPTSPTPPPTTPETPTPPPLPTPGTPATPPPGVPTPAPSSPGNAIALESVKAEFLRRYQTEVLGRLQNQIKELGVKYSQRLDRLEEDYMLKSDAPAVLEIRNEKERFAKELKEPAVISKIEKLGEIQRILSENIGKLRKDAGRESEGVASRLNSEFSEALLRLANQLAKDNSPVEAEAVRAFRREMLDSKDKDPLGVMAGVKEGVMHQGGEIADGNVALASNGATATAPTSASGMIDGANERESAAQGNPKGSEFTVVLSKAYRLSTICIELPEREGGKYYYAVDVSPDGNKWVEVEDRSKGEWRGRQTITFRPQKVRFIRIRTLGVEGVESFIVKEVEAYCEGKQPVPAKE